MIERVFLDMDGVMCDFITPAMALHGSLITSDEWPLGVFSAETVLGIDSDEFWKPINAAGYHFWRRLPAYPWLPELLREIQAIGVEIVISTTPGPDPHCPAGKRLWLDQHMPFDAPVMFGHRKELLARPGALLIDDNDKNCDGFRAAGGSAVLFPQRWNRNHGITADRIGYLREQIELHSA